MERMAWVGMLIKQAGFKKWKLMSSADSSGQDDRYADKLTESDPVCHWGWRKLTSPTIPGD